MRVLQITNLISHHQIPLAEKIASAVGESNFRFAAMSPPDPERIKLGWSGETDKPWILRTGESQSDMKEFDRWWNEADIVLCGERLFDRMSERLNNEKLCFYMSERWWKPPIGRARLLLPNFAKMACKFRQIAKKPGFYYLPMGPFAARDITTITNINNRHLKWGYFTDLPLEKPSAPFKDSPLKVLWAGRMLKWKKVETLIEATADLIKNDVPVELTLIGDGPHRAELEKLASENLNKNSVTFLKPVPSKEIHKIMKQHHVYVLPSDAYEGWGAVINEAMGCGLAVIASSQAGAAAAMIENDVNGFLFYPGDSSMLATCLKRLSNDSQLRGSVSEKAKKTITDLWSPHVAADRLLTFSESILAGRPSIKFSNGPMSSAKEWLITPAI